MFPASFWILSFEIDMMGEKGAYYGLETICSGQQDLVLVKNKLSCFKKTIFRNRKKFLFSKEIAPLCLKFVSSHLATLFFAPLIRDRTVRKKITVMGWCAAKES